MIENKYIYIYIRKYNCSKTEIYVGNLWNNKAQSTKTINEVNYFKFNVLRL